jgi:hypothetical protein
VAAVMVVTVAAIGVQLTGSDTPQWARWASLALAGSAMLLAGAHTVPSAVRLGARRDTAEVQSRLARSICRDHLLCVAAIAALLTIQLWFAQ